MAFYSSIICEEIKIEEIIDARTSDASHWRFDLTPLFLLKKYFGQKN
jgi:hypothetical protein